MTTTTQHAIDLMPQLRDILGLPKDLDLPKLFNVDISATTGDDGWTVTSQLWPAGDDQARWEALQAWGGSQQPQLSDPHPSKGYASGAFRQASVTVVVAEVSVKVWTHVDGGFVPPQPEPVRVTGAFADFLLGEDVTA